MFMIYILFSILSAIVLVTLLEYLWINRPMEVRPHWEKERAMRFAWAGIGLLVMLGQVPQGVFSVIVGLPVCLAHLRLISRSPAKRIRVTDIINDLYVVARTRILRLFERTNNNSTEV